MLDVQHINAFYGESQILHNVALRIAAGQRVALLGRNGAGKSTLLKSIMNAGPSVRGSIVYNGVTLDALPVHERARLGLALVPEDRRVFGHLTVTENVAMARYGTTAQRPAIDVDTVFARFPMLQPLRARYGGQLSGGQQQLLVVARAMASNPGLLLLDEPTEGLAPVIVEQMAGDIVRSCDESRVGLLLCEQNIWFARTCTSHVYVIDTGSIVFHGDWKAFEANPEVRVRYLAV